jgi:hypothetical protein
MRIGGLALTAICLLKPFLDGPRITAWRKARDFILHNLLYVPVIRDLLIERP